MQATNPQPQIRSAVKLLQAILVGMVGLVAATLLSITYGVIRPEPSQTAVLVVGLLVSLLAILGALLYRIIRARRGRV